MVRQNAAVVIAALAILVGIAAFAYRSIDEAGDTLGWADRTHQVLAQIERVTASYARSISARRAFLVAADASQLGDVPALDARMADAIATLRGELADDPAQLARLETLAPLLWQRVADLDAAIARQREVPGSSADTPESLVLAARVREVREAMEHVENEQLAQRNARTRRDVRRTKVAEVAGTFAILVFVFVALRQLRAEVQRRRESEEALAASERFLGSIVENLPDMIFVKEARELRFERINRAGERLLGLERKELVRKNDFDFFPADQAQAFQARDRETLANRAVIDIREEPIQTKNGERWLHTKKVPIIDEQGTPRYLLGISEDITDRRRASAALAAAKNAAEIANHELEAFSYSVAHDLRAPLRAIDGFSQAIEEDCADRLDDQGRQHLKRVRASSRAMGHLIDGLLGLSRLSRGELERQQVSLTRLVRQCATRLREAHPARRVDLVVEDGMSVEGDPRLLAAAFDNLLGNAWKFTTRRADARIEVGKRLAADNGHDVYYVRDNGAGFDQEYADKLFSPFQRLHAVTEFEGSGIGLATVQRVVRRHGGRIWAEGWVDRGATFYFTLG